MSAGLLDPAAVVAGSLFIGVVVLALLVADAVLAIVDVRRAKDDDDEALGRRTLRELAWSVAVTAALAVIASFAVDWAARLIWADSVIAGTVILLVTTLFAFLVGIAAVIAVVRGERPTYARIRRDLRDRATYSFTPEEVDEFAARLAAADASRSRRSQRALPLRLLAALVEAALAVVMILSGQTGFTIAFGAFFLVAVAAFIVAARANLVRQQALDAVLDAQRAQVAVLLERARIPGRGQVPGLRERVSRALAILREKQK